MDGDVDEAVDEGGPVVVPGPTDGDEDKDGDGDEDIDENEDGVKGSPRVVPKGTRMETRMPKEKTVGDDSMTTESDACGAAVDAAVLNSYYVTVSGSGSSAYECLRTEIRSERTLAIWCSDITIDEPGSFWVYNKRVTADEARKAVHQWQEQQRQAIEIAGDAVQRVLTGGTPHE